MGDTLQSLFSLPGKPPRSKLEPYRELIRNLRLKNWSYREIAALFEETLNLAVAPSTLHNFVRVRACERASPAIPASGNGRIVQTREPVRVGHTPDAAKSQLFEFTPGEALKLSRHEKDGK